MLKTKEQSLWFKMLESKLSSKFDKSKNIFVVGDPLSGKKKLIKGIQEYAKGKLVGKKKLTDEEWDKPDLDEVYIMDFKYLIAKQDKEDDSEELGKLNFYIFNKKYEFMKDFLTKDMLHNLILMVVLDLNDPENLQESFMSWIEFCYKSILSFITETSEDSLKEFQPNYTEIIRRMNDFGNYDVETEVKVEKPKEVIREENEEEAHEDLTATQALEVFQNLKIPIVVIGNKSDTVESINNDSIKDHLEYILRKLNIENQGILFSASPKNDWNIDLLTQFFLYVCLHKNPDTSVDLKESMNILKMFVKSKNDSMDKLQESFPNYVTPIFKKQSNPAKKDGNSEKIDIKNIPDFLADLHTGNFIMPAEAEENLYKSQNLSKLAEGTNVRTSTDFRTNNREKATDRIRDILGRNKA